MEQVLRAINSPYAESESSSVEVASVKACGGFVEGTADEESSCTELGSEGALSGSL